MRPDRVFGRDRRLISRTAERRRVSTFTRAHITPSHIAALVMRRITRRSSRRVHAENQIRLLNACTYKISHRLYSPSFVSGFRDFASLLWLSSLFSFPLLAPFLRLALN